MIGQICMQNLKLHWSFTPKFGTLSRCAQSAGARFAGAHFAVAQFALARFVRNQFAAPIFPGALFAGAQFAAKSARNLIIYDGMIVQTG